VYQNVVQSSSASVVVVVSVLTCHMPDSFAKHNSATGKLTIDEMIIICMALNKMTW
jgi:hypothetical protein